MIGYKPFRDRVVKRLGIKNPKAKDVGLIGSFAHMAVAGLIMAAGGYRIEEFTLEFPGRLEVADVENITALIRTHYEEQGFQCTEPIGDITFEKDGIRYCAVFDIFDDWMRFCFDCLGDVR